MPNPCRTNIDCSWNSSYPEPNGDIAGTEVVIGFVGTAYLVLFLLFIHYLVVFDPDCPPPLREGTRPDQSGLRNHLQNETASSRTEDVADYWTPNFIDLQLLKWIRKTAKTFLRQFSSSPARFSGHRSDHFQHCFDRAICNMCDIQIITGISVLTGGFICLDESLSSHHWQLIVYLAWFSCISHLSALTSLRRYLQVHSREKNVRLFFMFLLLTMLITAMVPTAFFNWRSSIEEGTRDGTAAEPNMPAVCFFSIKCGKAIYNQRHLSTPFVRSNAFQETMISTVLLITGFISKAIKLSTRISSVLYRRVTSPVDKYLDGLSKRLDEHNVAGADDPSFIETPCNPWTKVLTRPSLAIIIAIRTQAILFNSMLVEQYWLLVILLWGTSKLKQSLVEEWYYEKRKLYDVGSFEFHGILEGFMADNTRWEFGQILPVLLLAAPLGTMLSIFVSNTNSSPSQLSGAATSAIRRSSRSVTRSYVRPRSPTTIEIATWDMQERPQQLSQQHANNRNRTSCRDISTSVMATRPRFKGRWMRPYLISSCITLCGHTFGLFVYATGTFLLLPDQAYYVGFWKPMDFLFTTKGVFFLILLTYPFASVAIVLFGLTMDDWQRQPSRAIPRLFALFAGVVHTIHLLIIYLPTDWVFLKRARIILSVNSGLLLLFVLSYVLVQLSKRFSKTALWEGDAT